MDTGNPPDTGLTQMKQFSIRLDEALLAGLDAQIAEGMASDRLDAIRKAIRLSIVTPAVDRAASAYTWAQHVKGLGDGK